MKTEALYHISEVPKIRVFEPMPESFYEQLNGQHLVWAISPELLHNYLLPRNCPRVTFYAGPKTNEADKIKFIQSGSSDYVVAVETGWLQAIQRTTLYCYELPSKTFSLFDECAGYYISHERVEPISVRPIYNILEEISSRRHVELRLMPSITGLARDVKASTLQYSLIKMKNVKEASFNGISMGSLAKRLEDRK